jgi:hypothetical protein
VDWIHLAQDRVQWRALLNMVMKWTHLLMSGLLELLVSLWSAWHKPPSCQVSACGQQQHDWLSHIRCSSVNSHADVHSYCTLHSGDLNGSMTRTDFAVSLLAFLFRVISTCSVAAETSIVSFTEFKTVLKDSTAIKDFYWRHDTGVHYKSSLNVFGDGFMLLLSLFWTTSISVFSDVLKILKPLRINYVSKDGCR